MLKIVMGLLVALSLLIISGIHIYWSFGGKWGLNTAIPEHFSAIVFKKSNTMIFKVSTSVIAFILLIFTCVILSNIFDLSNLITKDNGYYGTFLIATLFLIRAVGDFHFFGILKSANNDTFSKYDSTIYVPLCFFIGLSSFYIAVCN